MAPHDDQEDECEDECEICGEDHETIHCGETFCGRCYESVENCDCPETEEIDAAEWVAMGRPHPTNDREQD